MKTAILIDGDFYNGSLSNKKMINHICSNNRITEILGISDKNLKIIGNNYENIKGIRYMMIDA